MNDKNLKLGQSVVVPVTEKGVEIQKDGIVKGLYLNDDNTVSVTVEYASPVSRTFKVEDVINPSGSEVV